MPHAESGADRIASLLDALERAEGDVHVLRRTVADLRADLKRQDAWTADRFEMAVDAAGVGVWDYDAETDHLTWNTHFARIFGLEPGRLEGTPADLNERVHPDDRDAADAMLDAAMRASPGGAYDNTHRVVWPDGTVRWVAARGRFFFDADGRAVRMSGTLVDITHEQERAQAIEHRLRTAIEHLPEVVVIYGRDLRIRYVNPATLTTTGRPVVAFIGKRDEEIWPEQSAAWLPKLRAAFETGHPQSFPLDFDGPLGMRHLAITVVPLPDARGVVDEAVSIVHDVTELVRTRSEAERASRAKDRFLAVLSHELRTPLAPVLVAAQMLESDATLSEAHRDKAQMIRRNAELEARLIDDLLDHTRIVREKLELQVEAFDAHRKIDDVLRMCAEECTDGGLDVRTRLEAPCPILRGDAARLQQVLWNLVKNAIKFTPEGGVIEVRTRGDAREIQIDVADTGIGIESEALPHVFEAFEQGGREVTRQFGGLGLGLAISRSLVELHGGTIRANSEGAGRGTTFTVSLPIVADTQDAAAVQDATPVTTAPSGLDTYVLVVDDHADTRTVLSLLLETLGCRSVLAGSVAEALAAAEAQAFDVVLSDIGLPDGTGIELMRMLRARHGLRGIALSGYGMDDDVVRSREAGFDAHLIKPVTLADLEATLRRVVEA